MRIKIIAGSLLGAVAVQVALVACGVAMRPDAGDAGDAGMMADVQQHADEGVLDAIADTARDVAADALDASGDAIAQDSGGCGCPAPVRATRSFAGSFGAGTSNMIRPRVTRASAEPYFIVRGGTELAQWNVSVSFYLTTGELVGINCTLATNLLGQPVTGTNAETCSVNVTAPNGTNVGNQAIPNATAAAAAITDTGGTITLPNFSAGTYRGTNIVVTIAEPAGGLLTPPSAYTP